MSSCEHFTENSWRPDLCTTCQRARSEHTGPRSWRRKSEPNPNNAITGVRISALASKFQTTSTEVDQRAKTLDRKVTRKPREIKLSTSRSIEIIDSSSSSSSSSSPAAATSNSGTVVGADSNKQTEAGSLIPHGKVSKDHSQGGLSATSILQTTTHNDITDTVTQPSATVGRPKLAASFTSSSQATVKSSVTNCSQTRLTNNSQAISTINSQATVKSAATINSQATVKSAVTNNSQTTVKSTITKSNLTQHSGSELVKKFSTSHVPPSSSSSVSSSTFRSQQTTKDRQSAAGEVTRYRRRVSIPDLQPEVIGHDGGLDNLFPQDESVLEEEEKEEQISLSLTDEEKKFALLALSNTIWNADIKNLQVETESALSCVREFEDLCVDELWSKTRFKSLVCSDPEPKHKNFGTFPQVSSSKQGRISVENLSFGQASRAVPHTQQEHCTSLAHTVEMSARMSGSRRQMSARSSGGHLLSSADSEGKLNCGSSGSSGDSGVEMAACVDPHLSYTVGSVTDCLYRSSDGLVHAGMGATDKANQLHDSGIQSPPQIRARSLSAEKRPESGMKLVSKKVTCPASASTSVEDDDVSDGFHAVDLLNEVLKDYTDMNESSTDDVDVKDVLRAKKCSEFEARMASVAATLDLTKPQQRGKRQAPRPPVSPPPEPNLAPGVSPKKVSNQPDPVFKMVTVGKSIVTVPAQQDLNHSKPAIVPYALEDFGSLPEASDGSNKTNGDGKGKKGITSFFRNILRRGKDSSDSFESINPEVHFSAKPERKDSTAASVDLPDEETVSPPPSCDEHKAAPRFSPQAKFLVMPPTSPPQKCVDADTVAQDDGAARSEVDAQQEEEEGQASVPDTPSQPPPETASGTSSPLSQRKASRGLASPKMMLKRATAKFSPPASRHAVKTQDKESDATASAAAKPYPAPKPVVPPPAKPSAAVSSSEATPAGGAVKEASCVAKESEPAHNPNVVRRRAKSPKRTAPPVPPTRTSVGAAAKSVSADSRNVDLAKELEHRLRKSSTDQSGGGTLSRSELRESTRRSMPLPPSPPSERKERSAANSPPVSPVQERDGSLPSSPSSPTGAFDFTNTEWSGGSTSTVDDDLPKFAEKIELPTVATQARKGLLGKLAGNRKTKAPQPPSVKRAKSVTQSSTLPRGDKKNKKINVADISGPVMVTDVSNNSRVLENRRNTISLGDEPAFVAMAAANKLAGGTTSSTSLDKSGFDEFDFPVLSPLGSLENLYESILPKPEGTLFHYYDPPTSPKVLCPNIPSDGYLEPVPPLSSTLTARAALSASSVTSISAASSLTAITTTLPSSSSSSTTTNISTIKSPMKSRTSPKSDRTCSSHPANVKDSGSSQTSSSLASTSSSEVSSRENSGGSLPDQPPTSARGSAGDTPAKLAAAPSSPLPSAAGLGASFVEPELTEQRRILLASQPIYEEIPNGGNEELDDQEDLNEDDGKVLGLKANLPSRTVDSLPRVGPPSAGLVVDSSKKAHSWLQQSHSMVAQSSSSACALPLAGTVPSSPSHAPSKAIQPPSSTSLSASTCMTSSQMMSSSLMTTSMTSSMLPPPPPPPDHLPAPQPPASRSVSRETVSSESDTQSNCSTLSRPRPAPRRKPKRPDTGGSDQYVSMNRPNAQVSLSEDKLRDVFSKLTGITFHALQDIYAQCEKILSVDRLDIPNSKLLKWADFDIYGQPLHASGRCVVYNAKLRANNTPCQIMILHSRPATEMCTTSHPSLLRPSAVFADTIPFSFLTPDFIKTSQLLQNSVYDSSQARCFLAVGAFDVVESLDSHLARLRETMAQDLNSYLNVMLTAALQLLSAMSHCLDQGFFVTETDYNDVFLITRADLRGKVVAFLPHQRSIDVAQGEAMCNFLDRLLTDAMPADDDDDDIDDNDDEDDGDDDDDDDGEAEGARIVSAPKKVVSKLRSMLEARRVECLGHVRTAVEYLLWGPTKSELPLSPVGTGPKAVTKSGSSGGGRASREQELYVWLEKERVSTVGRLARNVPGLAAGLSLEEFYTLKFLLKSSAGCLAESLRRLSR